jgi:hypothetical protein
MSSTTSLPLVLAGPILRRTSAQEMWIWFALSSPIPTVKGYPALVAECYTAVNLPSITDMLIGSKANKAVGLGEIKNATEGASKNHIYSAVLKNLHVYFVKISPSKKAENQSFPLQELLCYELFINEEVKVLKAGKTEDVVVRRGLHEHLYASKDYWKSHGVEQIEVPPGLRGFFAKDPNLYGDWDLLAKDAKAVFQYDQAWLRRYDGLWGATESTSGKSPAGALPITLIANSSQYPHFWSGSCFKLHGEGESATFLMHDDRANTTAPRSNIGLLADAVKAIAKSSVSSGGVKFPQALVLTGDQIYADDVPFLLTDVISQLAELLGDEEEPVLGKTLMRLSPSNRRELTASGNSHTPFSTDGVYNHLFTFAEYCAYHLMHMNAALWPEIGVIREAAVSACKSILQDSQVLFRIDRETKSLESSRFAVRSYSTVQSCVPTYALCDDHDVTDDWFMDGEWMAGVLDPHNQFSKDEKSKHSELGCRVIANAIVAYAAMHGIGNDPTRFKNRLVEVRRFEASKDKSSVGMPEYSRLLRILTFGDWSFDVPLSQTSAFCLDTRTHRIPAEWLEAQRKIDQEKLKDNYKSTFYGATDKADLEFWAMSIKRRRTPHLVGLRGEKTFVEFETLQTMALEFDTLLYRDRLLDELISRAPASSGFPFLLITPAPVCSIDVIEDRKSVVNRYEGDAELWRNNLSNFYRLVEALRKKSIDHCVIVSGDVHNANRRNLEVCTYDSVSKKVFSFRELEGNENSSHLIKFSQIVTSPLLNRNPSWIQRAGGTPGGKYLKPSTAHIAFSEKPGACVSINEIEEWQKSGRRYRETTVPICLKNQDGMDSKNSSDLEDDYYSFENNFASITLTNLGKNVYVRYYVS